MNLSRRSLSAVGLALAVTLAVSACGSDDAGNGSEAEAVTAATRVGVAATVDERAAVTLIDVRTPAEYAQGHLEGAVNYSLEDGTLEATLPTLDPSAAYAVYCRSGRRSAAAVELMVAAGFTSLDDLGAMDAAASVLGRVIVAE